MFKSAWFDRFVRRQCIPNIALFEAVQRVEKGLVSADLGSGVFKLRLARKGRGKSGGYRVIIFYRAAERVFFIYGYAKSDRINITKDEEASFRKAATHVLGLSDEQLAALIEAGQFSEVHESG